MEHIYCARSMLTLSMHILVLSSGIHACVYALCKMAAGHVMNDPKANVKYLRNTTSVITCYCIKLDDGCIMLYACGTQYAGASNGIHKMTVQKLHISGQLSTRS